MNLPNGIFFDEFIEQKIFSYLQPTKFKKGFFKWIEPYSRRNNDARECTLEILRINYYYITIKMDLSRGLYIFNLRKQKRTDKGGEYIEFTKISRNFRYYIDKNGDKRRNYDETIIHFMEYYF
jgi:hypothetical protein